MGATALLGSESAQRLSTSFRLRARRSGLQMSRSAYPIRELSGQECGQRFPLARAEGEADYAVHSFIADAGHHVVASVEVRRR